MAKITVQLAPLRNPQWSATPLKPGAEVTLSVEAPKIKAGQHIEFRILYGTDLVDVVNGQDAQQTAKWTVPNLPHSPRLKFDALLHEKPSPKAGIHGVLGKVSSPLADVKGIAVTITNIDANFVPHAEKIQVAYTVSDPGGAATSARIEVWGERYSTNQPLYRTDPFAPAHGAHNWNTWDGKANLGPLAGKYITPEYSPYRLRIIAGVDLASVDDPFAAGLKKVAIAEKPFEVEFQSVHIRVQANITEAAAAGSPYSLAQALAVEPYKPNGTYATMGRLPLEQETGPSRPGVGRIRIPMACHQRTQKLPLPPIDTIDQGGLRVADPYFAAGGTSKHSVDASFYTRPEIPLEFELRLTSRVAATNLSPTFGTFDKEAIGPVKLEPRAEDAFLTALYTGADVNPTYWRKAVCKVKHGSHTAPVNDGANPFFHHWQARFTVAADGEQNFDLDKFDANDLTYHYVLGSGELKVYLNRTLLTLGADEATINKGDADYIEVDVHTIKLRPNLTKANDVIWIVRSAAAGTAATWNAYPPGTNCHDYYGGIRGKAPNNLFRKDFSPDPAAPLEPIIGKTTTAYEYKDHNYINLQPDHPVPAANHERVEVSAILTGAKQGLAGVLFSPSYISGDSYILHGRLNRVPYERNLGWEDLQPYRDGKTGTCSVWRVMKITDSQRLPDVGTVGLSPAVGNAAEAAVGGRPHIADGVNMDMSGMNAVLKTSFCEWTTPPPGPGLPVGDVHKNVNLDTYRAQYMAAPFAGGIVMSAAAGNANNGTIRNDFVPFDHYRQGLPAGFPANRRRAAANVIATLPVGTPSMTALARVQAKLTAMGGAPADEALNLGVLAIPASPANWGPNDYLNWSVGQMDGPGNRILNAITPQIAQPKEVKVVRWPFWHENPFWDDGGTMASSGTTVQGQYSGNSQSFFITGNADPVLFQHEMGHSMHLVHFVAGNFGWKHHNLLQADCMMSYNFPTGFIVRPTVPAPVGPTAPPVDKGWPNTVPALAAVSGTSYSIDPAFDPDPLKNSGGAPGAAAAVGKPCITLATAAPADPCAKCVLKLRGWDELVLPVAWDHPDLF